MTYVMVAFDPLGAAAANAGAKQAALDVRQNAIPASVPMTGDPSRANIAGLTSSDIRAELFAKLGWAMGHES